jgi:hypothetical protein
MTTFKDSTISRMWHVFCDGFRQREYLEYRYTVLPPESLSEGNMRPRLVAFSILLLLVHSLAHARDPFSLSGTVTNTTNPSKPTSASATISFDAGDKCLLRIGAPLYGSGQCLVDAFDDAHHSVSIRSTGPTADITCTGMLDGIGYRRTYGRMS